MEAANKNIKKILQKMTKTYQDWHVKFKGSWLTPMCSAYLPNFNSLFHQDKNLFLCFMVEVVLPVSLVITNPDGNQA